MASWRFWMQLPALLPQALKVRREALRMPHAAGELHGLVPVSGQQPLRLLGLGDSVVAGVGVARTDQSITGAVAQALHARSGRSVAWQILGRSGCDSAALCREYLPQLPRTELDLVLISMGVNDVTGLTRTRRWRASMSRVLDTLSERYPKALLVLCGIPPMACFPALPSPLREALGARAARLDGCYAELARRRPNTLHVPTPGNLPAEAFAEDGFHPNAEGCAALAQITLKALLDHPKGVLRKGE